MSEVGEDLHRRGDVLLGVGVEGSIVGVGAVVGGWWIGGGVVGWVEDDAYAELVGGAFEAYSNAHGWKCSWKCVMSD